MTKQLAEIVPSGEWEPCCARPRESRLLDFFIRGFEIHAGRAAPSPRALYRHEYSWLRFRKIMLLFGCQLDHAPTLSRMTECGEDLFAHGNRDGQRASFPLLPAVIKLSVENR